MRKILSLFGIIVLFLSLTVTSRLVRAESGLPDSPKFGYGARLDLAGEEIYSAINAAANIKLDWIAIDFDWANQWPDGNISPDLNAINQVMLMAQQNQLSVMLSITHAPAWASTPAGPDAAITAYLVTSLAGLYPGTLLAVELFPGANTTQGWGASPNPNAYLNLLQTTSAAIQAAGQSVVLVAAGLTPLGPNPPSGDIDDLIFLESLYNAGAKASMPIVGIRLPDITGNPMLAPTPEEHRCLRHFEEVRLVMLNNKHRNGLIWITSFAWPNGTIQKSDIIYQTPEEETRWLNQAYQILEAQLYMGVAFFQQLNPPNPTYGPPTTASLIRSDLSLHPAFTNLGHIISPLTDTTTDVQTVLVKRIIQDIFFKPWPP
jgi:hypothetical protein